MGFHITWLKIYVIIAAKTWSRHSQGTNADSLECQNILMGRDPSPTHGRHRVCSMVFSGCSHPCQQVSCRSWAGVLPYRRALLFAFNEDNTLTRTCKAWNHIGVWLSTFLWLFKQEMWTNADFQTVCHHTACKLTSLFWSLAISLCSMRVTPDVHAGVQHRGKSGCIPVVCLYGFPHLKKYSSHTYLGNPSLVTP